MTFPLHTRPSVQVDGKNEPRSVVLYQGLTVIIGPNGSGKTQLLRGLKTALLPHTANKHVRYLSAGRAYYLEQFRSDFDGHRNNEPRYEQATYGSVDDSKRRHKYETLQGDFHTLATRPDILVKVRERLRKLFDRDLIIEWSAGNLKIAFLKTNGKGSEYSSAREASGLLHLVGLLSAIYDDEVGALLIDEPEVSLHPQLQAFLLKELLSVAGLPTTTTNQKLIIVATHSTEFIRVDSPEQLPNLVLCYESGQQPIQVSPDAAELKNRKLLGLLARMGQEHKLCFFSKTPLLIEGPSDAIICNGLSTHLDIALEAGGAQLLPVIGKGQFPIVAKLFRMLGKEPMVLADADGLADGLDLANDFLVGEDIDAIVAKMGFGTGVELSRSVFSAFCELVKKRWSEIASLAERQRYWVTRDSKDADAEKIQRRAAFSALFGNDDATVESLSPDKAWITIKDRLGALLDVLEARGCFILRRGSIESYYAFVSSDNNAEKPGLAAEEVAALRTVAEQDVEKAYSDVLRFLRRAATTKPIREVESLQDMLLAVVAPALARVRAGTQTEALRNLVKGTLGQQATLFNLEVSDGKLVVSLNSNILDVKGFPMTIDSNDDILKVAASALGLTALGATAQPATPSK